MNSHLTAEQRKTLSDLFETADRAELLRCVAGLVQHGVEGFGLSLECGQAIREVANKVARHDRARWTVTREDGQKPFVVRDPSQCVCGEFKNLHAATTAFPGITIVK